MGLTDSNSKHAQIDDKYKLIRRYTSDCYGDLTVIQNKQTLQVYALKQLITEDDMIVKFVENRKILHHNHLVILEDFWFSGDQSICSNIRKIQMVFQYYSCTLDEEMHSRTQKGEVFTDDEILHILTNSIQCLQYLDQAHFLHLIGSMKMLLYDRESKCIKIMENQQIMIHSQRNKKKQMNIIGFLGNKKIMPLHPLNQPKDVCDVCIDSDKIAHQNLFTLGLICLGLCWMREPLQLNIFGKGGYMFEKIDKRIQQIKNKYPNTHKVLSYYLGQRKMNSKTTYSAVLSQIYSLRKSFSKQNDKNQRLIDIQPVQKVGDKRPKKLSYLRQMRLSNNDIPNEY